MVLIIFLLSGSAYGVFLLILFFYDANLPLSINRLAFNQTIIQNIVRYTKQLRGKSWKKQK